MSTWQVPEGMTGDPHLLRVYAGAVRDDDDDCALLRAVKARPGLEPAARTRAKPPDLEMFPLEPVMRALDLVEFYQMTQAEAFAVLRGARQHPDPATVRKAKPAHPGLMHWAQHAVSHYLAALDETHLPPGLRPEARRWVRQADVRRDAGDSGIYELCAWGRRYTSRDGSVRELRLLRLGAAGERARAPGEVELAAYVTAYGGLSGEPPWGRPHRVRAEPAPAWVRVIEVGCLDGSTQVLFDGKPRETQEPYKQFAAPRLRATVDATERRPGSGCATCRLTSSCAALPQVPGILGISDASRPRRTLSVTDLRNYKKCPAQLHLRALKLPRNRDIEYGPEARRGQAVHAWLQQRHADPARGRCNAQEIREEPDWSSGKWQLKGTDAQIGAELIAKHAAVCPLRYADADVLPRPEPLLTFHDTDADTIIIARPDLLYRSWGSWVWREVKTTKYTTDRSGKDVLESYPQAALAVVLLAGGALGGDIRGSRVELEILRPTGPDLEIITPRAPDRVAKAREVLHALAAPWHADRVFPAAPGTQCNRCEVARWCPDAQLDPPVA